jgi:hypothetical protein
MLLRFVVAVSAIAFATFGCIGSDAAPASDEPQDASAVGFVLGTWTGTSTCVGNRPACKNETVVYRFVVLDGHPGQVRLFADKIIDGKRAAMGALVFDVDPGSHTVRSEFTRGQTHGVWSYTVADDTMTGMLVILPEGSIGRDVKAHRANDSELPAAPPRSDYDQ